MERLHFTRCKLKHTFEYHFKASSGMLYCLALSSRSLTSLGKIASKSLSLLDGGIVVVGIGCICFSFSVASWDFCDGGRKGISTL